MKVLYAIDLVLLLLKFEHSLDGTTAVALARWESPQAPSAMRQDREFQNLVKILDSEIIHAAPQI